METTDVTDELIDRLWSAGARTRKYPKKTVRERIKAKWRRILHKAINDAKQEARRKGHRVLILESPTRALIQSFTEKDEEIFYSVDLVEGVCTCPWFMDFGHNEKPCKHLKYFAAIATTDLAAAIARARNVPLPPSPKKVINLTQALRRSAIPHEQSHVRRDDYESENPLSG